MSHGKHAARKRTRWPLVMAATVGGTVLSAGVAQADETYHHSTIEKGFTLVDIGQIDDPAEDVLEHTSILSEGHNVR